MDLINEKIVQLNKLIIELQTDIKNHDERITSLGRQIANYDEYETPPDDEKQEG